jgi:hypothetical protein
MIYHIAVGNRYFTPTDKDLKRVVAEFKKPLPVFDVPVKIHEVTVGLTERLVLQIGAIDWQPTPEEIEALRLQFEETSDGEVVATRHDVKVFTVQNHVKEQA